MDESITDDLNPNKFAVPRMRRHKGYKVRRVLAEEEKVKKLEAHQLAAVILARSINTRLSWLEPFIFFNDIFQGDEAVDDLSADDSVTGNKRPSMCSVIVCVCMSLCVMPHVLVGIQFITSRQAHAHKTDPYISVIAQRKSTSRRTLAAPHRTAGNRAG